MSRFGELQYAMEYVLAKLKDFTHNNTRSDQLPFTGVVLLTKFLPSAKVLQGAVLVSSRMVDEVSVTHCSNVPLLTFCTVGSKFQVRN